MCRDLMKCNRKHLYVHKLHIHSNHFSFWFFNLCYNLVNKLLASIQKLSWRHLHKSFMQLVPSVPFNSSTWFTRKITCIRKWLHCNLAIKVKLYKWPVQYLLSIYIHSLCNIILIVATPINSIKITGSRLCVC